jgi:phosphatidylglycerol:prolipoprotein diacylglycerol transferase
MLNYINPTFPIFGLTISWYAICILIGVVIAVWLGIKEGRKLGISSDFVYIGLAIILPSAIIGARLWYVIFNASDFN